MANPFVFNIAAVLDGDGMPVTMTQTGPSPARLGPEMIALPKGAKVTVEATITPLGTGVLVDATASGTLEGQCVRCLARLTPDFSTSVTQVFSDSEDFITGDSDDDVMPVVDDTINLEQAFVDEMGLTLPFNPTCEPECVNSGEVPTPDEYSDDLDRVDPRWAGLEKFL